MKYQLYLALLVLIAPGFAFSHGGAVDMRGGHTDKNTGMYHCHKKHCFAMRERRPPITTRTVPAYNRDEWKHWSDFDLDCMNTRHEILKAQADGPIRFSPDGCYVSMSTWHDPFSGKTFTRASDLDVDHIVPLKWAHDNGGYAWNRERKEEFANDPINLLAVDDGLNSQKRAQPPTAWMPPNHYFRCEYLDLWLKVLKKYDDLRMHPAEKRIFSRQLRACRK